jgi:hypothetical protein
MKMKLPGKTLLYGFLVWLVPFVVGFSIYKPLHEAERNVFEKIMAIALVLTTVVFSNLHFRKLDSRFVREGMLAGVVWMAISLGLDLPMFLWGPMARPLGDYLTDIGMAYLIIPVITIGCGLLLDRHPREPNLSKDATARAG